MSDTAEKTPGKIVSAGGPVKADWNNPGNNTPAAKQPPAANAGDPPPPPPGAGDPPPPPPPAGTLNDDAVREYLKGLGIDGFENMEDLKGKVAKANTPAPVELTPEQKAEQEKAMDKNMLDLYLASGGTAEQFVLFKQLAGTDLKTLSQTELVRELKNGGFDDEQIKAIVAERYYSVNPDELPREPGEEDDAYNKRKDFYSKKNKFYGSKLENRSSYLKSQAEGFLKGLRDAVAAKDGLTKAEASFSSKVDEFASKLNREINLELGQNNNVDIAPVAFKISETDIAEVSATLKDSSKRNNFFFNPDNSLNLDNVGRMMLENKYLRSALKAVYLEGGDRQVAEVEKVFPGFKAHELGVGGKTAASTGQKGKIVSAGKPEPVRRQ